MAGARVSQVAAEYLADGDPKARVSQVAVEYLSEMAPPILVELSDELNLADAEFGVGELETMSQVLVYDHGEVSLSDDIGQYLDDDVAVALLGYGEVSLNDDIGQYLDDSVAVESLDHSEVELNDDIGQYLDDDVSVTVANRFADDVLVIMEMHLAGGVHYLSHTEVKHPSRLYEGDVISFGVVDRSIPAPAGFPRIGDLTIRIADRQRKWRKLLAQESAKTGTVVIKIGPNRGRESHFYTCYTGRPVSAKGVGGEVQLTLTDRLFEPYHRQIPVLITGNTFSLPEGVNEIFAPIIYGNMSSALTSGTGAVECPLVDSSLNRYLVSRYATGDLTVYVWSPGDDEYEVIPARTDGAWARRPYTAYGAVGWSKVEEIRTIKGVSYNFTYIQFESALPDGSLVRADVEGVPDEDGVTIVNPIWQLRDVLTRGMGFEWSGDVFAMEAWSEAADRAEALGYVGAYAYVQQMNWQEAIARLLRSFNVDLFADISGKISVALTTEDPADPVVFNDVEHLLEYEDQLPTETTNRIRYHYGLIPATGEWYYEDDYDNEADQDAIGEVIEGPWDLHYVQSDAIAPSIISDIAGYLDLSSVRMSFQLSAPRVIELFDLSDIVAIDHYEGFDPDTGTHIERMVKIIGLRLDLDRFVYEVDAIAREQLPIPGGGALESVMLRSNLFSGPFQYGRASNFFGVFAQRGIQAPRVRLAHSANWGRTWENFDGAHSYTDIGSLNAYQKGRFLHVLTQENTTGRVAYHRFDCLAKQWDIDDEQVIAQTAISSSFRSGEDWGYFGDVNPHADVIVRDNGEVVAAYATGERIFDDDTSRWSDPDAPGYFWYGRIHCVVRSPSGTWGTPFQLGDDAVGANPTGIPGNRTTRATPMLDPDGQTIWWILGIRSAGTLGDNQPLDNPTVYRMTGSSSASFQCKWYNRTVLSGYIPGTAFCNPPAVLEEDDDVSFYVPLKGIGSHKGRAAKLIRSELASYNTEKHATLELLPITAATSTNCSGERNQRGTFYVHEVGGVLYWSMSLYPGVLGSSDKYGAYLFGPGVVASSYGGVVQGNLTGGLLITARRSGSLADVHTKLFSRGGKLWAASFAFPASNIDPVFELWPQDEWGDDIITFTEFEEEFL